MTIMTAESTNINNTYDDQQLNHRGTVLGKELTIGTVPWFCTNRSSNTYHSCHNPVCIACWCINFGIYTSQPGEQQTLHCSLFKEYSQVGTALQKKHRKKGTSPNFLFVAEQSVTKKWWCIVAICIPRNASRLLHQRAEEKQQLCIYNRSHSCW